MKTGDSVKMCHPSFGCGIKEGLVGVVVAYDAGNSHTPEPMVEVNWGSLGVGMHYAWRLQLVS